MRLTKEQRVIRDERIVLADRLLGSCEELRDCFVYTVGVSQNLRIAGSSEDTMDGIPESTINGILNAIKALVDSSKRWSYVEREAVSALEAVAMHTTALASGDRMSMPREVWECLSNSIRACAGAQLVAAHQIKPLV